jgi:signal peptidase I
METTLFNGDRLIVLKAPRTWAKIRNKTFMPRRGEIIVFNRPNAVRFSGDERQLIKRVIALPGERVVVKDGILTVYNADNPGGFQPDTNPEYSEAIKTTAIETDVTVPEGHVFVCGDNRGNSLDSRSFGPINTSDVVGIATTRFLPLSTMKNL